MTTVATGTVDGGRHLLSRKNDVARRRTELYLCTVLQSLRHAYRYSVDTVGWQLRVPYTRVVRTRKRTVVLKELYHRTDKCFRQKIITYSECRKFKSIILLRRRNVKTNNSQ
jgi:hypothetical protein